MFQGKIQLKKNTINVVSKAFFRTDPEIPERKI